jgi:23S rRNA (pseudouridine1915-N3)-methyltransferase
MPNLSLLIVGDHPKDPFRVMGDDYLRRTQRPLMPELIVTTESKLLDVSQGHIRVALEERGQLQDSKQFAHKLEKWISSGHKIAFIIGAASGIPKSISGKCDAIWSLSPMTFPHRLAYCMLAEQIYRAGEILRNGPYHK